MTQIKQHTLQSGERIFMVNVPSDANSFTLEHGRLCFNHNDDMPDYIILNKYGLTPEKGQEDEEFWNLAALHQQEQNFISRLDIIGLSDEITEEEANRLVSGISAGSLGVYHKNYLKDKPYTYSCESALESFKSLMQSLGCEGRYAVLREVI